MLDFSESEMEELVASYEQLRREWLDGGRIQMRGLVLFLRRGMSAWVRAWRGWCGQAREDRVQGVGENLSVSAEVELPSGVYADAVYVLAEIAIRSFEEVSI